jgi:hypothetical protein
MNRIDRLERHVRIALTAPLRWISDRRRARRWRPRPEGAGVREPRRPRPTRPAAAVALAEPRTEIRRRIRLRSHREINTN